MGLGWILASCVLLSFYDLSKKASVSENAVFPVLLGSTLSGFAAVTAALAARGELAAAVAVPLPAVALLLVKSCLVGASWTTTYMALRTLPITTAAPIRATGPLWTFLGAVALFGERPTSMQAVGMAFAFLGSLAFATSKSALFSARAPLALAFVGTFFGSASALYDKCLLQQRGLQAGTVLWWFLGGMCVIYGAAVVLSRRAETRVPFQFRWTIPLVGILLAASDACYFNAVATPDAKISVLSLVRRSSVVLTFLIGGAVFRETNLARKGLALLAILTGVILLCTTARGDVQIPTNWTGTLRTPDGYFVYRMSAAEDGAARFADDRAFVLSPRADAPLREVVLRARNANFFLAPLVAGREQAARNDWTTRGETGGETVLSLSFAASDRIDAVRLWGTGDLLALGLSGTNENANALLQMLPAPQFTAAVRAADSLALSAALPEGAAGVRFRLAQLAGVPLTTAREDFANIRSTWEMTCDNAVFGFYESASMTDTKTASDGMSLRVAKGDDDGLVTASVLSPRFPAAVREYSFAAKRTSGESSDRVTVYGQKTDSTAWLCLDADRLVETSMRWFTNAVDRALGVTRLKFVFSATAATCRPAALDSLRVVYGGDETRETTTECDAPTGTFTTNGLMTARYAVAAEALDSQGAASRWSAEQIVDLAWANLTALAPAYVSASLTAAGVQLCWSAVEGAVAYRISATTAAGEVVCNRVTTASPAALDEIVQPGDYALRVATVLPDGRESEPSDPVAFTAAIGVPENVTAAAKGGERIVASWSAVPFATAYRVTVACIDGAERIVRTLTTRETSLTVAGLSSSSAYRVKVEAVGGAEGTWSDAVDMAATAPRRGEAVSLAGVFAAGGTYREDFATFATTNDALAHWQFLVAGAAARETRRTTVNKSMSAGVYAIAGADGATYLASRANSTDDVRLGLAFKNDAASRVRATALLFDAIHPDAATDAKAHATDWLVTSGATGIDADGEWQAVADDGALEGAVLSPGDVLIVRWRDDPCAASPVLGIDNISIAFEKLGDNGFCVILK